MVRVGVIGVGMMGGVHLDVYSKQADVQVVAVADRIEDRRTGKARTALNVQGTQQGFTAFDKAKQYVEGADLIADPDIDLIDICVPTPQHIDLAVAALKAGKHVLVEKPLANRSSDGLRLIEAAKQSSKYAMCAMCMRFWPGWTWLKEAVESKRYGRVLAAQFRRVSGFPGGWYAEGKDSGGALLDLHIHDTDFIHWCFGRPTAVHSIGYAYETCALDHVTTQYIYKDIPLVTAEGGWAMSTGFGFKMQYCVNFEKATAVFDIGNAKPLTVYNRGGQAEEIDLAPGMGYDYEIRYLLDCIRDKKKPETVTIEHAAGTLRIIEAEQKSVATGEKVTVDYAM